MLIVVNGSHPNLMPDLTASLDVELERTPGVLVVPRDAVRYEGERAFVRVQRGDRFEDRSVTIGATNTHEVVVTAGLEEGVRGRAQRRQLRRGHDEAPVGHAKRPRNVVVTGVVVAIAVVGMFVTAGGGTLPT